MMRGRSGLVAGTAGVVLLGLAGCGTSEHIASDTGGVRSSTGAASTATTTTPTLVPPSRRPTPIPETTATTPADPRLVKGAVYSFDLPPGWRDETDTPTGRTNGADVLVSRLLPSGHRVIVTVFDSGQQVLPSDLGSESFRRELLTSVAGESRAKVVDMPDLKIDGELAVGVRTTTVSSGRTVSSTVYMPTRFYLLYPILLVNLPEDRLVAVRGLRSIIDSWHWVD